jgi:hypothetical protein
LDEPYDFAALLKTSLHQRHVNEMRKQRAAGNEQVATRRQNPQRLAGKGCEECTHLPKVRFGQNRETGHWIALATVKRRRYPPDATPSVSQSALFRRRVFPQPVWRVGNDGVNGTFWLRIHPNQAIGRVQSIPAIALRSNRHHFGGVIPT